MEMMNAWLVETTHVGEKPVGWYVLLASKEIAYMLTEAWRDVVRTGFAVSSVLIPQSWVRLLSQEERATYYSQINVELTDDPILTKWPEYVPDQASLALGQPLTHTAMVFQDGSVVIGSIGPDFSARKSLFLDQYRQSAGLSPIRIPGDIRPLDYTLISYYSERDRNGNVYWAFQMVEHETGKVVRGLISGDDSNIYQITRFWNAHDDWDRTIQCITIGLSKKEFNRITAGWEYAGCRADDEIVPFIRRKLAGIG